MTDHTETEGAPVTAWCRALGHGALARRRRQARRGHHGSPSETRSLVTTHHGPVRIEPPAADHSRREPKVAEVP